METPLLKLKRLVREHGSQTAVGKILGVSNTYISEILLGTRQISDAMAAKLGYRRTVVYERLPGPARADRPLLVTQTDEPERI